MIFVSGRWEHHMQANKMSPGINCQLANSKTQEYIRTKSVLLT